MAFLWLCASGPAASVRASVLRLAPPPLFHPAASLSRDEIFRRIDALELFERLTRIAPDRLDIVLWRARSEFDQKAFLPALTHLRGARARFGEVAALEHAIGCAA